MLFLDKYPRVACIFHHPNESGLLLFRIQPSNVQGHQLLFDQLVSKHSFNQRPNPWGRLYRLYQHVVSTIRYPSAHPTLINP